MRKNSILVQTLFISALIISFSPALVFGIETIHVANFMDNVPRMEKIFDNQIAELRARGFGDEFLGDLMVQRTSVTVKAAKMDIAPGNIPFVPAISVGYGLTGRCGRPKLKETDRKLDIVNFKQFYPLLGESNSHSGPYYVFDVSSGGDMLGLTPKEAAKKLASLGRRPLNAIEGTFMFFLGGNAARNGMWFAGSRCNGKTPVVYIKGDKIRVDAESPDNKYSDRGTVSCVKE
ncbi:MAG TPA: DUF5701 family protein [Candidatus Paceibacterota bacterium]|nr:DUF5701 family protein [Candidatus Paceibacterota bacterium]